MDVPKVDKAETLARGKKKREMKQMNGVNYTEKKRRYARKKKLNCTVCFLTMPNAHTVHALVNYIKPHTNGMLLLPSFLRALINSKHRILFRQATRTP